MKKVGVLLLCALLMTSIVTSCQNVGKGGVSSQASSAASGSQTSSAPASSGEAPSSGELSSSGQDESSQESGTDSQPDKVYESGADYTLEITRMEPTVIDGVSVSMTVPVMGGAAAQKYGVSGEITRQINGTVQEIIADSGYTTGTMTLESETPYYSEKLLSIVMTVDYTAEGMAYPVHTVKTVNFILGDSGFSDFASAIEDNDAFREALTANNDTDVDDETLLSGVGEACVYFTETGVGIAVPVPHAAGDAVRVVIPYSQTEGFRTDDPAWNSFQ